YAAIQNKFKLFKLMERYNKNPLPKFQIIDLKNEEGFSKKYPVTETMIRKINDNINKNEQVLLFLNRRGFSNYMVCQECGSVINCEKCNISLTYHKATGEMICHYCGSKKPYYSKCDKCGSENLSDKGAGTQKIEDLLKNIFTDKNIARLDLDVSRKKGKLHEIIRDFENNSINILTGTQIISRGLNFPNVTLVGILYIDDILNLPDFRAAENVFDLIVQVSGRAGRDKLIGEVIIQTFLPDHFSIKHAVQYNFEKFYNEELDLRKALHYPPFYRLVKITFEASDVNAVEETSMKVCELLKKSISDTDVEFLGPISSPVSRIKDKHRYQLLIKCKKISSIREGLCKVNRRYHSVHVIIDVDPVSLL
ncbi:MAG: primosomal protein N', partial [Spirochaetes bacterium]|nr:primosomal protein N' [Spirochaetota bacterium]